MNRLQEMRALLELTQPQVSARLKEVEPRADVGMVSRYEKGVCLPTNAQLSALEALYGVPRTELYDLEDLDLVGASCVSCAQPEAAGLTHSAAPPLPNGTAALGPAGDPSSERMQKAPPPSHAGRFRKCYRISKDDSVTSEDNGVSQTVSARQGISLKSYERVRTRIPLRPYRTFTEVEQPESIFLIRVSDRGISFIEADGGMWKLSARETIKRFLEEQLQQEVTEGSVIIVL